ncbi:MAG TPA: putative toxin-antitoxin system toxin component, PIN family [Pirellulales bacterium]
MRVVLDTNVVARALPGRNNAAEAVLLLLLQPPHTLIVSEFVLAELARMLRYGRMRRVHGLPDDQLDAFVGHLRQGAEIVDVAAAAADAVVPSDPDDDPIVATAVLGHAEALATWDRHLFSAPVQAYLQRFGIRVMRETDVLAELRQIGRTNP